MMERNARFYFANLCADVIRCIAAAEKADDVRYRASLERAWKTIDHIRSSHRPEAYEEALLLLRALELRRESGNMNVLRNYVNALAADFAIL